MELEGLDVVSYLSGPGSVRDGSLVNLVCRSINNDPVLELTFEVTRSNVKRTVKLELRDILEFGYLYTAENPPTVIEFVKCITTESGEFYLSLDPYDERELFVSEKDGDCFRSKSAKLMIEVAPGVDPS